MIEEPGPKKTNYVLIDRITYEYLKNWSFDDPKVEDWNCVYYNDNEDEYLGGDCFLFNNKKDAQKAKKMLEESFLCRGDEVNFDVVKVEKFVTAVRYRIVK